MSGATPSAPATDVEAGRRKACSGHREYRGHHRRRHRLAGSWQHHGPVDRLCPYRSGRCGLSRRGRLRGWSRRGLSRSRGQDRGDDRGRCDDRRSDLDHGRLWCGFGCHRRPWCRLRGPRAGVAVAGQAIARPAPRPPGPTRAAGVEEAVAVDVSRSVMWRRENLPCRSHLLFRIAISSLVDR